MKDKFSIEECEDCYFDSDRKSPCKREIKIRLDKRNIESLQKYGIIACRPLNHPDTLFEIRYRDKWNKIK